jgi:hypothetical protein
MMEVSSVSGALGGKQGRVPGPKQLQIKLKGSAQGKHDKLLCKIQVHG